MKLPHLPLLVVCLCCFGSSLLAQNGLDSLYRAYYSLSFEEDRAIKTQILADIITQETYRNPDLALRQIDSLTYIQCSQGSYQQCIDVNYRIRGSYYAALGQKVQALKYYRSYIDSAEISGWGGGYFLIDVGNIYYSFNLNPLARKLYQRAEQIFRKEKHLKGLSTVYGNYGLLAQRQDSLQAAIGYTQQAIFYQLKADTIPMQLAHAYTILGKMYEKVEDYEKAEKALNNGIETFENHQDISEYQQFRAYHLRAYAYLMAIYDKQGKKEKARYILEEVLPTMEQKTVGVENVDYYLSVAHSHMEGNNLAKAYLSLQQAESLLKGKGSNYLRLSLDQAWAKYYNLSGEDKLAAQKWQNNFEQIKEMRKQDSRSLSLSELLLQQEKDHMIQLQKQSLRSAEKQGYYLFLIVIISLLALLSTSLFLWKIKAKNKILSNYAQIISRSNENKKTLLSVIGHDLRNPFNYLLHQSHILLERFQHEEGLVTYADLQQLEQSSKQIYLMMEELLQWVRLEDRDLSANYQKENLSQLLHEVLAQEEDLLQQSVLHINVELPKAIYLETDANLLKIIFRNMLMNAAKHSQAHEQIRLKATIEQNQLVVSIQNPGSLPKQTVENLHKEEQLDRVLKGQGLGLRIIKQLSQQLGLSFEIGQGETGYVAASLLWPPNIPLELEEGPRRANQLQDPKATYSTNFLTSLQQQNLLQFEIYEAQPLYAALQKVEQEQANPADRRLFQLLEDAVYEGDRQKLEELYEIINHAH